MPNTPTLSQDPGPYSALFDYKEEAAKEEAKNLQLQESQKKIMKTNVIGDAFRLLIDGVGGSKGATITPKGVNPGIVGASGRLTTLGKERDSNLERLRMTDMANKSRDIAYNTEQARISQAYRLKLEEEGSQRKLKLDEETRKNTEGDKHYDQKRKDSITDQQTAQDNSIKRQNNQAKNTRDTQAEYQRNLLASFSQERDRSVRTAKEDVEFIIPGTAEHIYISPAEILEMQSLLIGDKKKYDPSLEAALKDLMKDDPVKQESGLLVLKKNWSKVKGVLGYANETQEKIVSSPSLPVVQSQSQPQQNGGLKPEESTFIQSVASSLNHTPEQKRLAIYQYLTKQGYDTTNVKDYADQVYQNLIKK